MNPYISVIVPVYNAEKYLEKCIQSILNQTFVDFELILIDDGCTDKSGFICDEYAKKDNRIVVIHQENRGQAASRNIAVNQAKGSWICFVDSDDLIHHEMLDLLYAMAVDTKCDIAMCSAYEGKCIPESFENTKQEKALILNIDEYTLKDLYNSGKHRCWTVWGKLIKKEIVSQIPFTAGKIFEDNAVVCKWLVAAKKVVNIEQELYFYFVNDAGTTKSSFNYKKLDYLWALEEMFNFYYSKNYFILCKMFVNEYMKIILWYSGLIRGIENEKDLRNRLKKDIVRIYFKRWEFVELSREERIALARIVFPHGIKMYDYIVFFLKSCRSQGIKYVTVKVINKILGWKK